MEFVSKTRNATGANERHESVIKKTVKRKEIKAQWSNWSKSWQLEVLLRTD